MSDKRHWRGILGIVPFLFLYFWLVIQTAWVSDDAFITFRSIENFIHGYGPIYNIGERVQTFTHPLWFLLQSLANWLVGLWQDNPLGSSRLYYVNILLSLTISAAAIIGYWLGIAGDTKNAILGIIILSLSKAFVDYSTSGLENPLTHLIIISFLVIFSSEQRMKPLQLVSLSFLAAAAGLNRVDLLLPFLPALAYLFFKSDNKLKTLGLFALGFLPLIVWEIFSVIYYGFPFPNTAYAKLNTGISHLRLVEQAGNYYLNSLRLDPLTLLVIAAGVLVGMFRKDGATRAITLGVILYLVYILYIGGDFMSGRFFTPPLLMAVSLLSRPASGSAKGFFISLGLVLTIGIAPLFLIPERHPSFGENASNIKIFVDTNGISDEQRFYYNEMGLLKNLDGSPATFKGKWIHQESETTQVEQVGTLGVAGYRLGPNVHVIDRNALADPLMVRMPLEDINNWRIGHFHHTIPEGYVETLTTGENQIKDPVIALYYDKLSVAIKGDLWSWQRFVEIWNLNTGKYKLVQ